MVVVVARHRHSTIAVLELDAFAHGQDTVLRHTFQTPSKSRLLSSQVEKLGASTLPAPSARTDHADSLCLEAPYTHPLSLSSSSTLSSMLSPSSTGSGVHLNFVWNFFFVARSSCRRPKVRGHCTKPSSGRRYGLGRRNDDNQRTFVVGVCEGRRL